MQPRIEGVSTDACALERVMSFARAITAKKNDINASRWIERHPAREERIARIV